MNPKQRRIIEEEHRKLFDFMGLDYPYKRPKTDWHKSPDPSKVVVFPDPHEPYSHPEVIKLLETEKDSPLIICTGDLGDFYSKSRFRKKYNEKFQNELRSVFFRLEWMATHWKKVKVLIGNHDDRTEKMLLDRIDGMTDLLLMVRLNLLELLASFFDNVEIVGVQMDSPIGTPRHQIRLSHIYQHGDIVFTHCERSSANKDTLMKNLSFHLHQWSKIYGLRSYSILAQSHNHADYRMNPGAEKWILMPAAANPFSPGLDYIFSPKMYGQPPATGYAVFYQMNGKTDYNRSHNVVIEP